MCDNCCNFKQKSYTETNIKFNLLDDAIKASKELNLSIDNRLTGFYLVKYNGYICTNRCSSNFMSLVDSKTCCDVDKEIRGQLSFDIDGNIQEDK